MSNARTAVHLEAPIDWVFEVITDYKRLPEWNVEIEAVKEVLGPAHKVGSQIHLVMKLTGRTLDGWAEVLEVEPPGLLKLVGRGAGGAARMSTYRLTPRGTATRLEAEVNYELPAGTLGRIPDRQSIERAAARDLRRSLENLKVLVEAPAPALV